MITFIANFFEELRQALVTLDAMISLQPAPLLVLACSCCNEDIHGDERPSSEPDDLRFEGCLWPK